MKQPLLLLLLHLWFRSSSCVVTIVLACPSFCCFQRQHQNSARTTTTTTNQQHTSSCKSPINFSFTSKSSLLYNHHNRNNIEVSIVNSNNDILSLADIRYQEWMTTDPNPPSIHNFRLATVEIFRERSVDGAMVFLAKLSNNNNNLVNKETTWRDASVVGAAELSPIELKDVVVIVPNINNEQQQQRNNVDGSINLLCYVTDVVTSSSSRRLGVGSILMNAVEKSARDLGTRCLLLHVADENEMARRFYEKLNYVYVVGDSSIDSDGMALLSLESVEGGSIKVDTNRLALNAGTTGQLLMMKELKESVLEGEEERKRKASDASQEIVKKGFGKQMVKRDKKMKRTN